VKGHAAGFLDPDGASWLRRKTVHERGRAVCFVRVDYARRPPSITGGGQRSISGLVYLGIDPFFYFEDLRSEPGMPNLFRQWVIRRILLETTPGKESTDARGGRVLTRADVRPTFAEVSHTDAWHDDQGRAHYVLECGLQSAG
jgi:hypothetical protein